MNEPLAQRLRRAKKETRTACLFFVCSYSVTKGSKAICRARLMAIVS